MIDKSIKLHAGSVKASSYMLEAFLNPLLLECCWGRVEVLKMPSKTSLSWHEEEAEALSALTALAVVCVSIYPSNVQNAFQDFF